MRLERGAIYHVHRLLEQAGDVFLEPNVIEYGALRAGLKFHQDVQVAVRSIVASSH